MSKLAELWFRLESKSWLDQGLRTWVPQEGKALWLNIDSAEYQGDLRYSVTVHLCRRAFQYTVWTS